MPAGRKIALAPAPALDSKLQQLVEATSSADDLLRRLDIWLDQMNTDADWALLAMELQLHARRSPSFAAEFDDLHARHRERLGGLIGRLFALSGKVPPMPVEDIAGALAALAHGLVLQRPSRPDHADPTGATIRTILRSLIAAAPDV
jgi:hypothetical protein